jgi:DNA-binding NtrC family response regulator
MPPTSVLLVEDDDAVRGLFEDTLKSAGFAVRAVSLASDTFEALRAGTPDVIVLDLGMPRGTLQGMEMFCWGAWGHAEIRPVPGRLGVAAILAKPLVEVDELTRTIRRICR